MIDKASGSLFYDPDGSGSRAAIEIAKLGAGLTHPGGFRDRVTVRLRKAGAVRSSADSEGARYIRRFVRRALRSKVVPKTDTVRRPMTRPQAQPSTRMAIGTGLALVAAAFAGVGLLGALAGSAQFASLLPGLPPIKPYTAAAVLALVGGWRALQSPSRSVAVFGYALVAIAVGFAGVTLIRHAAGLDPHMEVVVGDRAALWAGLPAQANPAIAFALFLASGSIALTRYRSERAENARQCLRLSALVVPLFAIALHVYDPMTLGVIEGFEATPLIAALSLAFLLFAVGFDRPAGSLRWQVANIGVVVVVPLAALTVHFASAERDAALAAASERLAAIGRLGAERQDAVVAQTRQMLSFLARSSATLGAARCAKELADYVGLIPGIRSLYIVDGAGAVRCASDPAIVSLRLGDRDYVREAFAKDRFTVSGLVISRLSGTPMIALAMPASSAPGAGPDLLLAAALDVGALSGPLETLGGDLARGETLLLLDRNGTVIAARPKEAAEIGANLADATLATLALANPGQAFEAADLKGEPSVFYGRRVLDGQATLIVGAPRREVTRPVDARLNTRLLLIAGILLGSLALGVLGTEIMVLSPVRRLTAYAGRLEAGDLAARPDVRASGEVAALGRALEVMATAIEDREHRLGEAEALFRGLFDHSPDAKVVVRVEPGSRFRIETWNAAATASTGLAASEVIGREPRDVFPGARGLSIEHDMKRSLDLGRVTTVEREPHIDGLPSVYEVVHVPLRGADGAVERIFLSARDISERKRVERLKSEFVSTVSHELRTPLTSIAGSLGLLAGGAAGPLGEQAKRLIQIAHSNSLRLVRLINDILDVEKIEAGRMTFDLRSVSVADLAAQAIADLRAYADGYGVDVELLPSEVGLTVYGDQDRLIQVVTNLLSNAIKFSPRGGLVTVSAFAAGEAVSIVVKDRGPGIPEAFRSQVFTKFAQADGSDSRRKGGTGLGLAICREIVERHAGALTYRTAVGEGTEFEVQLPRHVTRRPPLASTSAPVAPRPKVLICEDDALIAAILAEQMRDAGFESVTAGTVRAALKAVQADDFVAALVDLNLPDGDGLGLIRDLRRTPKGASLPVVVVSADADTTRHAPGADRLDVAAWMRKPVDASRLAAIVLQRARAPANRPRILHVEDDVDLCNVVSAALASLGDVVSVTSVAAALREIEAGNYELAILDVALEDGSGLDVLKALKRAEPRPVPAIIFSARDAERGVGAITITKSRKSLSRLAEAVKDILDQRDAARSSQTEARQAG
ncbi:MAG: hypothetical protein DI565_07970 [Ancylobacter novellus]|uniref:histidine kinase n=1 Tax=Ancylobacter novellus TaxID=921 RepID=A0A2W5KJ27_ANCNO|nr:MAG: hypothetical protein DI565_07970 [Ancylobacter novellus]